MSDQTIAQHCETCGRWHGPSAPCASPGVPVQTAPQGRTCRHGHDHATPEGARACGMEPEKLVYERIEDTSLTYERIPPDVVERAFGSSPPLAHGGRGRRSERTGSKSRRGAKCRRVSIHAMVS
jgi:hypothetical protein